MESPRPLLRPHMSTMPDKLKALSVTIVAPALAHAHLPAEDALASAFSGLESATTVWPSFETWPCITPAQDDAWDEVVATLPCEDALTKTWSAESAVAVGAPTCAENKHPSVLCLNSPSRRLVLNLTVKSTVELDHVLEGWDANASVNQCCKIPHVAEARTGVQSLGPTASVLDLIDKNELLPRQHQGPRQYRRTITSATGLRVLNIPIDMHCQLGLGDMYPRKAAGRRRNVCTVHIATSAIHAAVVMLRTTSRSQHHRRLSTGWRDFCARADVEIGDALTFERLENDNKLTVHVDKNAC